MNLVTVFQPIEFSCEPEKTETIHKNRQERNQHQTNIIAWVILSYLLWKDLWLNGQSLIRLLTTMRLSLARSALECLFEYLSRVSSPLRLYFAIEFLASLLRSEGASENCPQFQLRVNATKKQSPAGATDKTVVENSAAPSGLADFYRLKPAVETAGYSQPSLCDFALKQFALIRAIRVKKSVFHPCSIRG
jgi:hypothetical protein